MYYYLVLPWKQRHALQELHIHRLVSTGEIQWFRVGNVFFEPPPGVHHVTPSPVQLRIELNRDDVWITASLALGKSSQSGSFTETNMKGNPRLDETEYTLITQYVLSFRGRKITGAQHSTLFISTSVNWCDSYVSVIFRYFTDHLSDHCEDIIDGASLSSCINWVRAKCSHCSYLVTLSQLIKLLMRWDIMC